MQKRSSIKDFQIEFKLGEGAFGIVYKVKRISDGQVYAIKKVKIVSMKEKEKENAVNEIRILASFQEEFIIGYKDAFFDEGSNCLCIVMEYAEKGDLMKKINLHLRNKTYEKEEEIWKAIADIGRGIKSLHDKNILHRDLKCANIFIDKEGRYKLGDLNVSKVLKGGLAYTQTGTPYYASPEVWMDKPYNGKSDVWSLGCVIYEMASLKPPFQASDLQGLYKKVKAGKFQRIPMIYSNQLALVIKSMLKVNPKQRISIDQLLSSLDLKGQHNLNSQPDHSKGGLLKTIKFNPYNLRALKDKLPPANYQRSSHFLPQILSSRQRAFSACGIRNYSSESHHQLKQKPQHQPTPIPLLKSPPLPHRLPPRPNQNHSYQQKPIPSNQAIRQRSKQNIRRIGYNILTGRSNSVQRDY